MKLIREEIETSYKNQMKETLDQIVKKGSIAKKDIYSHPKFVEKMVDYIVQDFTEGRTALDSSIGAMIVCDSSEQAIEVDKQLERLSVILMHLYFIMKVQSRKEKMIKMNLKRKYRYLGCL